MSNGRLIIFSGASGTGKDTVLEKFFKLCPDVKFSISTITRPVRKGEKPGEKYNFVSNEEFEKSVSNGEFLEYNYFVGGNYATPKAPVINAIENGFDIIAEVDVNGAAKLRAAIPDNISIFVLPPDFDTLRQRLISRGNNSKDDVIKRLDSARSEIERACEYDYVIVNEDVDFAAQELAAIIKTDRLKSSRNMEVIKKILDK